MFPLQNDDTLTSFTTFTLYRGGRGLKIEVHHILSGADAGAYRAYPVEDEIFSDEQFWGHGNSELSALRNALLKLQPVQISAVFPRSP
ncbi:hypothetical protein HTZ97_15895 [Desulfuromonas acetoxidans]|uniref:Uncharacterized protein n=1 Tax=Desulfuromonas acetoxidans (strain DSM 684 / 11070) TaxID=281689 RepID=Q1JVI4_DESA6|nr:hypothetical protein [Desulfuromonas acetoxidans]EAT14251.1 hypothetical protein Dace_0093 [Desulfuromonas acetoxidans DSM 684]MBF0646599.1 hypothetical protein [Desulfuromonas acetoxidans]NVD26121.1 hypothetical protein [Desulfuromonas acetoxidans]NVE17939.1 hypothetical protein [Desulfuromonas acetoxidans]